VQIEQIELQEANAEAQIELQIELEAQMELQAQLVDTPPNVQRQQRQQLSPSQRPASFPPSQVCSLSSTILYIHPLYIEK
jgi:hypothetical protein